MTTHLRLSGACRKLERALVHLDELGNRLEAISTAAKLQLSTADEEVQRHRLGTHHLFRCGALLDLDPDLGLVVGDYVHNLRSALDHLAWELVRNGSMKKGSKHKMKQVQFPIYSIGRSTQSNKKTFASEIGKNLPGVSREQTRIAKAYQPYHHGRWHLGALATLSNRDKHRVLTPTSLVAGLIQRKHLSVTKGHIVAWQFLLKDGQPVNKRTPYLEVVASAADAEVMMNTTLQTRVAFREGREKIHRARDLEAIGEVVAEIIGKMSQQWGTSPDLRVCQAWPEKGREALGLPSTSTPGHFAVLTGMGPPGAWDDPH